MRIFWIKLFFLIFFFCLLTRLFYWQIVRAEYLQVQAEGQYFTDIKVGALRGNIYFADGSTLASINPSFSLFGQPKLIAKDKIVNTSYLLAKILVGEEDQVDDLAKELINKLSQDFFWVSLKKGLLFDQKKQIENMDLDGIGFEQGSSRFYPEGSTSAHILGFVGSDAKGDNKGYFGIEGFYDGELKGLSGSIRHEKDAVGL